MNTGVAAQLLKDEYVKLGESRLSGIIETLESQEQRILMVIYYLLGIPV